ncbi:hypothetical protein SISNIDRAFT_455465 [Sistotremastrum niveocremeum HHB9708]|uniref:Uncharacterized protein n=1 Tax=Sistotremastrum niveocremeum HHB9708 TaxID=1314777 RepID=A0A164U1V1_9AGAM|nr:hypothetical protein SISNIDRAFT_455465 [Sistotremastrum niveocremeum HHB9708]
MSRSSPVIEHVAWMDESLSYLNSDPQFILSGSLLGPEAKDRAWGKQRVARDATLTRELRSPSPDFSDETSTIYSRPDSPPSFLLFDFDDDEIAVVPDWSSPDGTLSYQSSIMEPSSQRLTPTPWTYDPSPDSPVSDYEDESELGTSTSTSFSVTDFDENLETNTIVIDDLAHQLFQKCRIFSPSDKHLDNIVCESLAPLDEQLRYSPNDSYADVCWQSTSPNPPPPPPRSSRNRGLFVEEDSDQSFSTARSSRIRFHLLDTLPEDSEYDSPSSTSTSSQKPNRAIFPIRLGSLSDQVHSASGHPVGASPQCVGPSSKTKGEKWKDVRRMATGVFGSSSKRRQRA